MGSGSPISLPKRSLSQDSSCMASSSWGEKGLQAMVDCHERSEIFWSKGKSFVVGYKTGGRKRVNPESSGGLGLMVNAG